jgi:probable F420-dependent oxidoreductase
MKIGITVRTMGPQSTPSLLQECAAAADDAGLDALWIADHIAIPPDQAEGSGGRYLDPLTTLAFLAAKTRRIGLGTGVLVLPYRPALPTAKGIATVQELSANRLLLGVGVGWMEAEFRAVGADRRRRGRDTDETLKFFHRCFAADEVEANGQKFLFKPRPPRPPIFVGGAPPHALRRAVAFGEGWMPIGGDAKKLRPHIERLQTLARQSGRKPLEVATMAALPLEDVDRTRAQLHELADVGVSRVIHAARYNDAAEYRRQTVALGTLAADAAEQPE